MSSSVIYPSDPMGSHAMGDNAAPRPIVLFGNYDCANESKYNCKYKVKNKGDKCTLCQVSARQCSVVDIQSEYLFGRCALC